MNCKAFERILKEMNSHPERRKKWLNDKRLTIIEKKIIEGYTLVRNNQNHDTINLISNLSGSGHEFVNAQKNLLLGIAHNNLSHFEEATFFLDNSIKILKLLELNYFLFIAYFNKFMVSANINNLDVMRETLSLIEEMPRESRILDLRLFRCQFLYAEKSGDDSNAKKLARKILLLKPEMAESDLIAQLVAEFVFYIKIDDFVNAREVLNQMKQHRKFNLTENFNFMKILLDHITLNTPIYAYAEHFQSIPMLYHQLQVIQALEAQDLNGAKKFWELLQQKFPNIYLDNFQYSGSKCLFSQCLKKYEGTSKNVPEALSVHGGLLTEKLFTLLTSSAVPLSKSYLFEVLWGHPPTSKDDLGRLASHVKRIRAKYRIDIQSRKGTYFIEQKVKKKRAS